MTELHKTSVAGHLSPDTPEWRFFAADVRKAFPAKEDEIEMSDADIQRYVAAIRSIDQMVMNIVYPPGTLLLLAATVIVAVPGLLWLFLLAH